MICPNYLDPQYLIISADTPALLYYSHLPAIIVSLLIGFFVYFKNKSSIAGKVLLAISVIFSLWTFFNLIVWTNNNSETIIFVWSFFGVLYVMLCMLCLYFVYTFISKKDLSLKIKTVLGLLILPVIFFAPTSYNIRDFSLELCGITNEGIYYNNYYYGIGFLMFIWILFLLVFHYRKVDKEMKKQIILLGFGIEFFLFSFFITGYIASLFVENSYNLEFYGLFGMTFFMGMLAYLIVRFKAFNIKLIGAQALVVALNLLIASQFFFIKSNINMVLTGITFSISLGFGYMLIRSVKREVQQKEELQKLTHSLERANIQLKKLDNAKTEFISIASHQLRTPITAIKGFSSLVLEGSYGEITESVQGAMEKIYSSSQRLVDLIEDLLNVSRIESGKMQFNFELGNIEKILGELYDNFILVAKTKKFYLDYKHPETPLPEIMMDAGKVRELVSNFIDNALKYTEKGGVTIRVEMKNAGVVVDENGFVIAGKISKFGKVVRITVADTGIGIPKEEIPYLFKKFSRGKDVSRLHVGGTGLGLYVGKAIADAHHGEVWVESDGTGMGSRFIIEIPVEHE